LFHPLQLPIGETNEADLINDAISEFALSGASLFLARHVRFFYSSHRRPINRRASCEQRVASGDTSLADGLSARILEMIHKKAPRINNQ
jgi:hypothetical protein